MCDLLESFLVRAAGRPAKRFPCLTAQSARKSDHGAAKVVSKGPAAVSDAEIRRTPSGDALQAELTPSQDSIDGPAPSLEMHQGYEQKGFEQALQIHANCD
jgi:hypothetical protein